jgi:hypothetical protein
MAEDLHTNEKDDSSDGVDQDRKIDESLDDAGLAVVPQDGNVAAGERVLLS